MYTAGVKRSQHLQTIQLNAAAVSAELASRTGEFFQSCITERKAKEKEMGEKEKKMELSLGYFFGDISSLEAGEKLKEKNIKLCHILSLF